MIRLKSSSPKRERGIRAENQDVVLGNEGGRVAEQTKNSGNPIGVVSFVPWIVFGVASGLNHWRVATGGGLILCVVYLAVLMRRGVSIKMTDWTMLIVFVIGAV